MIRLANEDRVRSKFKRRIRKRIVPKLKNIAWRRAYLFFFTDPNEEVFFEELKKDKESEPEYDLNN